MAQRHITYNTTLQDLRDEILFSATALRAHPLTRYLAAAMEELLPQWGIVRDEHQALRDTLIMARGDEKFWDINLDGVVDGVDFLIPTITGAKQSPLYDVFFGKNPPSVIKKPVLGNQLSTMEDWLSILAGPNVPEALKQFVAPLTDYIQGAKEAIEAKKKAAAKLDEFLAIGPFKKFVDELNRRRGNTYNALNNIALAEENQHLPRSFSRDFFLKSRSSNYGKPTLEEELESVRQEIEEATQKLALLNARLTDLVAQKESKDREETERQEKLNQIDELERALKALRAEVGKK